MRTINIPKTILYQKYIIEKKSTIKIGKEFGVVPQTIANKLHMFKIPIRNISETSKLMWLNIESKNNILKSFNDRYYFQYMSLIRKGKPSWNKGLIKETDERIKRSALKHSETRKRLYKEGKIKHPMLGNKIPIDKNILYQKYIVEKKSLEEVGKEFNVTGRTIFNRLYEFGISIRKSYELCKERWQNPEYRNMNIIETMKAQHKKPNQKEIILGDIIKSVTPDFLFVGDGGKFSNVEPTVINGRVPDFINVNGQKKAINFNGTYWHLQMKQKNNPNLTKEQVEEMEKEPYKKLGWDLLIVWEDELKDKEIVMDKIRNYIGNSKEVIYGI